MKEKTILIVDRGPDRESALAKILQEQHYQVTIVTSLGQAIKRLKESNYDLILTELHLIDGTGMELLDQAKRHHPHSPVVLLSQSHSVEAAVEALKAGASDYLVKPISPEVLSNSVRQAMLRFSPPLLAENPPSHGPLLIAESPAMRQILEEVEQVAQSSASVLITGESGTGKEVIAHLIHARSMRAKEAYVRVNCAAIPPPLFESEFFGHEKGAFTGATQRRMGRFEVADRGSLLLDEVTEIPPPVQAKLLRVLQEMEFARVGGNQTIHVDVRVMATSNRDPLKAIEEKNLRADLYYRLNVIPISIPPLRERPEDILPLAESFLYKAHQRHRPEADTPPTLSEAARTALLDYAWPGNVRELMNIVERAVVLYPRPSLEVEHLFFKKGS